MSRSTPPGAPTPSWSALPSTPPRSPGLPLPSAPSRSPGLALAAADAAPADLRRRGPGPRSAPRRHRVKGRHPPGVQATGCHALRLDAPRRVCAACAACAAPDDTGAPPDAKTDSGSHTTSNADTSNADTTTAVAPGTEGTLALDFRLDAVGQGPDRLDWVSLLDAAGTLELDGVNYATFAYLTHAWEGTGYQLYDLVSIAENGSNLAVTYLYCQGDELPYAYTESFVHPMDWEATEGACDGAAEPSVTTASLPPLRATPPPFDPGVRIDGDQVAFDGSEGHMRLDGHDRALMPFDTVDCTDCPGGPWLEVHSLLVGTDDACFGILYLYPDDPDYVQLAYGICLPSLTRLDAWFYAPWSGDLVAAARPAALLRPAPRRVRPEEPKRGE